MSSSVTTWKKKIQTLFFFRFTEFSFFRDSHLFRASFEQARRKKMRMRETQRHLVLPGLLDEDLLREDLLKKKLVFKNLLPPHLQENSINFTFKNFIFQ